VTNENVTSEFPAMGEDVPVVNVSGQMPTIGATMRHQERGSGGRFKPREPRIVGPLNQPSGRGGFDSVTGEFRPGVRDNSQLHDYERTHFVEARQMRFVAPEWGRGVDPARKSHDGSDRAHDLLNHAMTCPCLTTGGACNGG
jgi:hypothetical protein